MTLTINFASLSVMTPFSNSLKMMSSEGDLGEPCIDLIHNIVNQINFVVHFNFNNSDITAAASFAFDNISALARKTRIDYVIDLRRNTLKFIGYFAPFNL